MAKKNLPEWKLKYHSHPIADTGDYSGQYEITNGHISIFADSDDDDEVLSMIVILLNDSNIKFYQDDSDKMENEFLKNEQRDFQKKMTEAENNIENYSDAYLSNAEFNMNKFLNDKGETMLKEWARQDFIAGARFILNKLKEEELV